jgi:hypothetical protein
VLIALAHGIELLLVSQMIRTRTILAAYDYVIGIWLIVVPWIFGFGEYATPTVVSLVIGFGIIIYSLFTNYKFGLIRLIPDELHSVVDLATGFLLCLSPWLFKYSQTFLWPHLLTGIFYLLTTVAMNRRRLPHHHNPKSKMI